MTTKLSKRRKQAIEGLEKDKVYAAAEALELVKRNATARFDETIEVAINLGVDPRKQDQQVRGSVTLPAGTGKDVRVAVFATGEKAREAEEAGADVVGDDELIERVGAGWFEFDASVATPDMMPKVGRIGKLLGPRGLMPNPKSGTVTMDVGKTVQDIKGGKVEYRTDKFGNVHLALGKASFDREAIARNLAAVLDELIRAKPAAAKGKYILGIALTSTMGPSVRVDPNTTPKEVLGAPAA